MKLPIPRSAWLSHTVFPKLAGVVLTLGLTLAAPGPARSAGIPGYDIIPLGRGHNNRLCLAATIEGTKGLMILDTGAGATLLSNEKYGSLLPDANRKLPPGVEATANINGMKCPVSYTRDFHVGSTDIGKVGVCLVGRRYLYETSILGGQSAERQYDGILGENILRRYHTVLDCGRLALYLNTDPARKANLGPALTQAGWTRVPMSDHHNDFVVPCEVNGRHFRLLVDTGSPFTNLNRGLLNAAGLSVADTSLTGGLIGTNGERVGFQRLNTLRIGDYTAMNLTVFADTTSRRYFKDTDSSTPIAGLLGGDFLAANNAMIDVDGHALYLKRGGAKH